ncbi:ClpP family protease [Egibacter rhizosphaerae]|uniref:ClpP family protease n=1 Tax=Egibacter rhizosphaerae TaxID=1670831 RepID=UPI0013F16143|nr:ATP-dependent Clp protease proteolytic subunit [Egibacter rhizosphaerae]
MPHGTPGSAWPAPTPFDRLFERRILFLRGSIEDTRADELCAELVALDAQGDEEVTLFIDSLGGASHGMLAIHDVIQTMGAPVRTRCVGVAASAAAVLLATGTGPREATENARVMLHQPSGGVEGTTADIAIQADEMARLKRRVEELLASRTGQPVERIRADTDRDLWLSADEAMEYGLIDRVVRSAR